MITLIIWIIMTTVIEGLLGLDLGLIGFNYP